MIIRPEAGSSKPATPSKSVKANQPANASSTISLPTGKYACYFLSGSTLNYAFIDIHIDSVSRYRDKAGKSGTYSIDENQKIVFSGSLASANAKLLAGPRIGLNMNGGNFFNTTCIVSQK